jgi:hypothetical protein
MTLQFNCHKRIGITPGARVSREPYGKLGTVYILRLWWSALTLTLFQS